MTLEEFRRMFPEGPDPLLQIDQDWIRRALEAQPDAQLMESGTEYGVPTAWRQDAAGNTLPGAGLQRFDTEGGPVFSLNSGGRWHDRYNDQGQWTDRVLSPSAWVDYRDDIVKPAATMAAMYYGANALMGGGAPAAGGGVTAADAGLGMGTMGSTTGGGLGAADIGLGMGTMGSTTGAGVGGGALAGGGGIGSALGTAGGIGQYIAPLLGAAAGAADSRDRENTTTQTRDPWAPAQPFLQSLLGQGQELSDQYRQQPFSGAQQTAYGNLGGLLDAINAQAPGLLSGANLQATGARNFDRANPRRQLPGGAAVDLSAWAPGLLGALGTRGR